MTSVRFRVTAVAALLVALLLVVASVVILRLVETDLVSEAEGAINETISDLRDDIGAVSLPEEVLLELNTGSDTVFVGLIEGDDELIAEIIDPDTEEFVAELFIDPSTGEVLRVFAEGEEVPVTEISESVREVIASAVRLETGQYLIAGVELAGVRDSIESLRRTMLVVVPLLVLAMALIIWWLVGLALRPVSSVTARAKEITAARAKEITAATLHERVPEPRTEDEIGDLARVLNDMLDRIEGGVAKQRQFVADASHELRTPLAAIRAAAEIQESTDLQRSKELAEGIQAEVDRMDGLVDDLLALARLDESDRTGWELFDLAAVSTDLALRRTLSLEVRSAATGPVWVHGRRRDWERVVDNLVANADRHGASSVEVETRIEGDRAVLRVTDDGPGIPEADRERVFERFTRLDEARSPSGFGLGLAIVRAVARSHGGDAVVDDPPPGGGTTVVVTVPRAAKAVR